MNETIIKEIKSIYSSGMKSNKTTITTPVIETIKPTKRDNRTFFNGVIDKLNIIVKKH